MNYFNKYTGTPAAQLDYQGDGKWIVIPAKNNRFRKLYLVDRSDDKSLDAIDLEGMAGMLQVGYKLPGYNREITSIQEISEYKFIIKCLGQ